MECSFLPCSSHISETGCQAVETAMRVAMADSVPEERNLKEMEEDELWDMINNHRHRISLGVKPCMVIPYLRQARVLTELDEDEILNCMKFSNWTMKTSHMLDILRIQGRNGAIALLEGLMIHFPKLYTQITGRRPNTEPSEFSGLIKSSELTEYLVRAVTGMQRELQDAKREAAAQSERCAKLEAELCQALQRAKEAQQAQAEHSRLRSHMTTLHHNVLKLKDEKCDLYMRYTAAVEEKSAVNIRCRDLQLQVYQLQCEVRKAQTETDFQRQKSLKYSNADDTQQLRDEISSLRRQLLEAKKFTPAREDILVMDLEEARDGRTELVEQLHREKEEKEQLAQERDQLLEEKECLALQVQKLSLDCDMYQQKSAVIQSQLEELQEERDQAYLARDEAQAHIARSLAEKDTLRGQLVELQDKLFLLRARTNQNGDKDEHEVCVQHRRFSWDSSLESSSEDPGFSPPSRPRLRRMAAICPERMRSTSHVQDSTEVFSSFRSEYAEPPSPDSMRKRQLEEVICSQRRRMTTWDSFASLSDLDNEYVVVQKEQGEEVPLSLPPSPAGTKSSPSEGGTAPPFLVRSRPKMLHVSTTSHTLTISFQGDALLSQLQVVGGNMTGVFIHQVKEGSSAQNVGLSPGVQIVEVQHEQGRQSLSMVLEDSTLEEAVWALSQVRGFCHLSVRDNRDAYENLLLKLQSSEVTSGDSFYVRVNVALPRVGEGALAAKCNDIVHVTNTRHGADGLWKASHVNPYNLQDLKSGTVPNYYRAQRLLIRAIEDLTFQQRLQRRTERSESQEQQKAVRIISTGRLGRNPLWVCVEEESAGISKQEAGDSTAPRGCVTLMPYTLVTPHHPPASRPVLVLPTILGLILKKRLGELQGFRLCEPEVLNSSQQSTQMQRPEVLENCGQGASHCYTLRSVEKVIKQGFHCVLPLGLDCVRRLHRAEIFPIVIFIASSERSIRRLRHKLQRHGLSEEQLLECSHSEEPLLDKLPCLYRSVAPNSWSDSASLLATLRAVVQEEQKKTVWVEPDLW